MLAVMTHRVSFRGAAIAAFVLLPACNNGGAPCTIGPIAITALPGPRMVSPVSGTTGLPTSGFSVTIAFGSGGANHETLRLVDQNQQTVFGPAFSPIVPAPTPPPPGTFGPVANEAAAVPQLAAHTTYTVFVDGASPVTSTECPKQSFGGPFSDNVGTFTTQ